MELARYLLAATNLPVKEVAFRVGIPDVNAFNKLCKGYFRAPCTLCAQTLHSVAELEEG